MRLRQLVALTAGTVALIAIALPRASACPWWGGGYSGPAYGPGYGPAYYPPATTYYAPPMYYAPGPAQPQMVPGGMVPTIPVRPMPGPTVTASDDKFEPTSLTVQPGTNVRFVNNGQHVHTVTDRDGRFDSGDIPAGGNFTVTFRTPGTYKYYCKHHKGMEGTITVGQAGKAPAGGAAKGPAY